MIFEGDEFQALVHDFNHMAERLESLVGARSCFSAMCRTSRCPLARLSVALELSREDADPTMEHHLNRIQREPNALMS